MSSNNDGGSGAPQKSMSMRQLLRQQRELEEQRKFGLAPLAMDTETHQEISPNIPAFISRAPWYYGAAGPTLAHQKNLNAEEGDGTTLVDKTDRIVVKGQAEHFTAGACKNCGSRTHQTKECFQAKKKIGAVYTNKVTGLDLETQQEKKNYSQKRDRFVGDVGVDLMRGAAPEPSTDDADVPPSLRRRPEDLFSSHSAQHGGVEVKELPKYLYNLDQQESLFFDPKTGSMRANPNASDSARAFQGDLSRYTSGDYYNYVEAQHRFLTGQSKAFVDFEFDEEMRRQAEGHATHEGGEANAVKEETAQDILLRSLYGGASSTTATAASKAPAGDSASAPLASAPPPAPAPPAGTMQTSLHSLVEHASMAWQRTYNGHLYVFGSYLDPTTLRWGYRCCQRLGKEAEGCIEEK